MKKKELESDFSMDMSAVEEVKAVQSRAVHQEDIQTFNHVKQQSSAPRATTGELINCLQDRIITVRHLPQPGSIMDPKHVLYGGMAERAVITITVPKLRSGTFKNVLTNAEKDYLEYIMGLESGALNIYNKVDNFWDNATQGGVSKVRLTKQDTQLNLKDPIDYIKYKILLANTDLIAPDLYTLQDKPKATYRFVLISNDEVNASAKTKMSTKMQCYVEYGKVEHNEDVLRAIIEIITSKPLASNTKLDFLQTRAGELIDADSKLFLSVIKDPLLATRILIKKCVEQGFISKRGDYLYLRSDNTPLCEGGEEPTMNMAAKYLSNPKRQDMKFALEAKVK